MTLYGRSENAGQGGADRVVSAAALESAVALLAHLETDQLEKMNEDETEMITIIDDSELVKSLQAEREVGIGWMKRVICGLILIV